MTELEKVLSFAEVHFFPVVQTASGLQVRGEEMVIWLSSMNVWKRLKFLIQNVTSLPDTISAGDV